MERPGLVCRVLGVFVGVCGCLRVFVAVSGKAALKALKAALKAASLHPCPLFLPWCILGRPLTPQTLLSRRWSVRQGGT